MELNWLIIGATGLVLVAPSLTFHQKKDQRGTWLEAAGFLTITAIVIVIAGLPDWYNPDLAMSSVPLTSKTYPPTMTLPHVGFPGIQKLPCQVSGMHNYNMAPGIPDDLNSETATTTSFATISTAGWLPHMVNQNKGAYTWHDWVVFSHATMQWPFYFHPSYDSSKCGMGPDASLWQTFQDGGTYCQSSETLYVKPAKKKACLGDFIAALSCEPGRGYCHLPDNATVKINGIDVTSNGTTFALSPFDSDIQSGTQTPECNELFNHYYYGTSSLSIHFPGSGLDVSRAGNGLVPETIKGSRHLDHVIKCNMSSADVPNTTLVIGILPTPTSFVYHAASHTVDLYQSHKVTLSNDWRSVLIINLCLLCLAHWLADTQKNALKNWTVVPEIIGLCAAAAGIYLQKVTNSVYHRCADIPNGPLAAELVTWLVLLELTADVACLVLLRSKENPGDIGVDTKAKINNVRRLSYECALLGSVFLQVVSSSDSMFDSYMGFFVGAAFLYSGTYRCLQTFVQEEAHNMYKNHIIIQTLAACIFAVSSFAFYTLAAMPSVDPVAGLSHHVVEAGTLCTAAIVVFGVVGLAERV